METPKENPQPSRFSQFMVRHRTAFVWIMRIIIGGVFVISGLAKLIDPWGFIYKMDQYLAVWGMSFPRTITLVGSIAIAGTEFVTGVLLLLGCFKRTAVWILTAAMAVMLPLTLYILIANPVSDCGCFGDFWVISNAATFLKNVALSLGIIYLLRNNRKARGLFHPATQWLVAVLLWVYAVVVGFVGYNFQPMIDFRLHPVGTDYKVATPSQTEAQEPEDDEIEDYVFIYQRDGEYREFDADNLPDEEDGWVFVDRQDVSETKELKKIHIEEVMTVLDEDGEDVTQEVFNGKGYQVVLLIPDLKRVDISYTLLINELARRTRKEKAEFFAIIATDKKGLETWRDISMADYPCYIADDTDIKELARGNVALLLIEKGKITGKRNISSLDDAIVGSEIANNEIFEKIKFDGEKLFWQLTSALAVLLLILWVLQSFVATTLSKIFSRKKAASAKINEKNE